MLTLEDILRVQFSPGSKLKPGYASDEVDDYLDEVVQAMVHATSAADFEPLANPKFKVLRSNSHSYHQNEVDDFIDAIVHTFKNRAENLAETEPYLEAKRLGKESPSIQDAKQEAVQQPTAIVSFDDAGLNAKSKEIAEMLSLNMFDSPEILAGKVKEILKN